MKLPPFILLLVISLALFSGCSKPDLITTAPELPLTAPTRWPVPTPPPSLPEPVMPGISDYADYYPDSMSTEEITSDFTRSFHSKDPRLVWTTLRWTRKDLVVKFRNGRTLGLFSTIAKYAHARTMAEAKHCSSSQDFRLLSVTGNIIGFEHTDSTYGQGCSASVYSYWRFVSIDLAKMGSLDYPLDPEEYPVLRESTARLSLADLFGENEVLAALLANPSVAQTLSENETPAPTGLKEFVKLFGYSGYRFGQHTLLLELDFPLRFVFKGVEEGKVVVAISLTPGAHSMQAVQKGIDIRLPIPARLRKDILAAASGQNGFLMNETKTSAGTGYTDLEFGPKVEWVDKSGK